MNWNMIHQLTFGFGAGTFCTLYIIIFIKGLPEAIKLLKNEEKNNK